MKKVKYYLLTKSIGLYINLLGYMNPGKASALAYRLFSEPRDGKLIADNLPEILRQAKRETFIKGEHEYHAHIWNGNDTRILLVHGWESNAARWEKMLPHLNGSTIIALDAPAHGLSGGKEFNIPAYADFIDIAVRHFNPDFLIGHSIGGSACVYYQYKFQNPRLRKMVLLGAPSDMEVLINNYVKLLGLNTRTMRLLENYFSDRFQFKLSEFSVKIFGRKLIVSGIVAHDKEDTVVAFDEGKKIAGSWKNAVFIETNGLGHSMHDADLYSKVSQFLFEAE